MIEGILGIIKVWLISRALSNPSTWIAILVAFSALLLLLAIFVKFKNGFISLICFVIVEAVGLVGLASLLNNNIYSDNLYLKDAVIQQFTDVSSQGVIYRKRFRVSATPLLGITLPDEDSSYFQEARNKILSARFNGGLYMSTSSAYSGVVLYDSGLKSINEQLLQEGLASTTSVCPKQYSRIQAKAIQNKRGIWQVSSGPAKVSTVIIEVSRAWLILLLSVCAGVVLTPWLRKALKRLQSGFLTVPE